MQCSNPKVLPEGHAVPYTRCGNCESCRVTKAQCWTGRILLETFRHPINYFVTLTYGPNYLNRAKDGTPTLVPDDGEAFRQAVRWQLGEWPRYFWAGEYGDKTQRPHYHAMMFGIDPNVNITDVVTKAWPLGYVEVSHATPQRARYLAGYTTKKLAKKADTPEGSRHPEYQQMSRLPALGDDWVTRVLAPWYTTAAGSAALAQQGDVAGHFRYDGHFYPFSDRHRRMMRKAVGIPELRTELKAANPQAFPPMDPFPPGAELERRRNVERSRRGKKAIAQSRTRGV